MHHPGVDCLNCSFPNLDTSKELTLNDFITIVNRYKDWGGQHLFLTGGGEPSEHHDFIDMLLAAKRSGLSVDFNTWGIALTKLLSQSDEELHQLFPTQNTSFISVSIHSFDEDVFKWIKGFNSRAIQLDLSARIRTSFLIHRTTTPSDIDQFLRLSQESGARFACIKPAYEMGNERKFPINLTAYEYSRKIQKTWNDGNMTLSFPRLDRLNAPVSNTFPLCLAPLETMFFSPTSRGYMCCDMKGSDSMPIINGFPRTPLEYYFQTLMGIIKFPEYSRNCIQGCNYHEQNIRIQQAFGETPVYQELQGLTNIPVDQHSKKLKKIFREFNVIEHN